MPARAGPSGPGAQGRLPPFTRTVKRRPRLAGAPHRDHLRETSRAVAPSRACLRSAAGRGRRVVRVRGALAGPPPSESAAGAGFQLGKPEEHPGHAVLAAHRHACAHTGVEIGRRGARSAFRRHRRESLSRGVAARASENGHSPLYLAARTR